MRNKAQLENLVQIIPYIIVFGIMIFVIYFLLNFFDII